MEVDQETERAVRRKRERIFRKFLIAVQVIIFLIPIALCAVLLYQVNKLEDDFSKMAGSLNNIIAMLEEQQGTKEGGQGEGSVSNANAGHAQTSMEQLSQELESESVAEESVGTQETSDIGTQAAHKVYLTFDDGPSIYTEEILDILDEYNIKATFFVLGKEDEESRKLLQDIVDRGHTLGMHSYSHSYEGIYGSVKDFAADFKKLQDFLYDVTGVESCYYRFPGGSSNTVSQVDMQEFAGYLKSQDVSYFDWNISSGDGGSRQLSVEMLVENCTKGITERGTNMVLMHDSAGKRTTVEALPIIIEKIQAMEDTVILPITEDTKLVQHLSWD